LSDFISQVGGAQRLRAIVEDLYERILADPIIGFMFDEDEIDRIIDRQTQYLMKHLGDGSTTYEGEPIRKAHQDLPITSGHADRRHQLVEETLDDWEMPASARQAWLELDASLRDLVVRTGEQRRDEMTGTASDPDDG
jgi:hemoglobin